MPRTPGAAETSGYRDLTSREQDLKSAVHRELISKLDLEKLMHTPDGLARQHCWRRSINCWGSQDCP